MEMGRSKEGGKEVENRAIIMRRTHIGINIHTHKHIHKYILQYLNSVREYLMQSLSSPPSFLYNPSIHTSNSHKIFHLLAQFNISFIHKQLRNTPQKLYIHTYDIQYSRV